MTTRFCVICRSKEATWRFGLLSDFHVQEVCDDHKSLMQCKWSSTFSEDQYYVKRIGDAVTNDQFMLIPNEDGTCRKEPFTQLEDIAKEQTISDQVSSLEHAYENLKLQNADYRGWLEETEKLLSKALIALTGSGQNKLVEDIEKYLREHTNATTLSGNFADALRKLNNKDE